MIHPSDQFKNWLQTIGACDIHTKKEWTDILGYPSTFDCDNIFSGYELPSSGDLYSIVEALEKSSEGKNLYKRWEEKISLLDWDEIYTSTRYINEPYHPNLGSYAIAHKLRQLKIAFDLHSWKDKKHLVEYTLKLVENFNS